MFPVLPRSRPVIALQTSQGTLPRTWQTRRSFSRGRHGRNNLSKSTWRASLQRIRFQESHERFDPTGGSKWKSVLLHVDRSIPAGPVVDANQPALMHKDEAVRSGLELSFRHQRIIVSIAHAAPFGASVTRRAPRDRAASHVLLGRLARNGTSYPW
jgi:hypothetical protein